MKKIKDNRGCCSLQNIEALKTSSTSDDAASEFGRI